MAKDVLMIEDTIKGICKHYSAEENISGILKVVDIDEFGIERIKIVLIYVKLPDKLNYFGFNKYSDKRNICDNVILLMDSRRENIDFGLLSHFKFMDGEPNAFCFLEKGEILYDKTGRYEKLQAKVKKDGKLRRTKSLNSVPKRVKN